MANTPRYDFVTPSPWADVLKGANVAMGGIMQEQAASERQKQRLRSMASTLAANGFLPDSQVYEQMALQETPDYGTAALTGKATTRDLSMPFDHVLKVMEKQRDRSATLEAAGIRAGASGTMSHRQLADAYKITKDRIDFNQSLIRDNDRLIFNLQEDRRRIERGEKEGDVDSVSDEIYRLQDEKKRLQLEVEKDQRTLESDYKSYWGNDMGTAPTNKGKTATDSSEVPNGDAPDLPTAADKAATTESVNHEETLLPNPNDVPDYGDVLAEEATIKRAGRPRKRYIAPVGTPPFTEADKLTEPAPEPAPTAIAATPRDLAAPPVVNTLKPPSYRKGTPAQAPVSAPAPDSVTEIPRYSTEAEPGFVGPPTPEAFKPTGLKIPSDRSTILANLKGTEKPVAPPADAPEADQRAYDRASSQWRRDELLRTRKSEAIKAYPSEALMISEVKTMKGLTEAVKAAAARKGMFGFDSPSAAETAGEAARVTMQDGENFSVVVNYNVNTGKHGYTMVKKSDADKTPQGYWRINKGPYMGQIFKYDEKGSVIREMPDGSIVKYRLKTNPNADVTKAQFETWIADLVNSPLADSGLIPVYVSGTEKATSKLEQKGAIPSSARGSKKLDNFEQEYKGP